MDSGVPSRTTGSTRLPRRAFIRRFGVLTAGVAAGGLLVACGTQPPAPTSAPAAPKPAESKPAETKPAAAAPTQAPAQAAAKPAEAAKPAASGQPKRGGILKFALNTDPPKLDPAASGPTGAIDTVCSMVYSRLVNYKPDASAVVRTWPRSGTSRRTARPTPSCCARGSSGTTARRSRPTTCLQLPAPARPEDRRAVRLELRQGREGRSGRSEHRAVHAAGSERGVPRAPGRPSIVGRQQEVRRGRATTWPTP